MLGDRVEADERDEEHAIVGGVRGLENADDFPDRFVNVRLIIGPGHAVRRAERAALLFVLLRREFRVVEMQVQ